ncbi:MAG TPA: hypothetical protein VJR89_08325 [Polyangiales bacterium]|nr:hypothetical protein [Polyangiales bacterium]
MRTLCLRRLWPVIFFATLVSSVRASAEEQEQRPEFGYWSVGDPRFFVSARPELGTPYAKPYVSAGYGLPHWIWAGVDLNAVLTMDALQVYSGVRLATPVLDLAFGVRDNWSFNKPFLRPQEGYTKAELNAEPGPSARYWAWEAEAVAIIPLPYAAIIGDFVAIGIWDKPEELFVYDEAYRAVVADDLYLVMRVGAIARLLNESALKIGVLTEHVFDAGRRPTTRIGPMMSLQLTDHVDVNVVLTVAVSGPDNLGIVTGSYGVAGVRWRWASGERRPEAPWEGTFIPKELLP